MTTEEPGLTQLLDRLKSGAAFQRPQITEIKPEVRSAAFWNPCDIIGLRAGEDNALLMEVRFDVLPDKISAWLATLRRFEPRIIELTKDLPYQYLRTYATFAGENDLRSYWRIADMTAFGEFARIATPDSELGRMLLELSPFIDRSDPTRFQVTLRIPATASYVLDTPSPPAVSRASRKAPAPTRKTAARKTSTRKTPTRKKS